MDRIVKITEERVIVGTEGGGIIEVRREDLDFEPSLGDSVNIFTSETETIVAKAIESPSLESEIEKKGININITNQNASNNTGNAGFTETNNGRKVVNRVTYVLFAILLGSFGAHKFYSGSVGLGILYLLFCWTWIPGIVGIIEGIIALIKIPDANGNIVV